MRTEHPIVGGRAELLTGDLNYDQVIQGVKVVNPIL